jgi:hypothetical protein
MRNLEAVVEDVLSELGNIDIRDYQVVTDLKRE